MQPDFVQTLQCYVRAQIQYDTTQIRLAEVFAGLQQYREQNERNGVTRIPQVKNSRTGVQFLALLNVATCACEISGVDGRFDMSVMYEVKDAFSQADYSEYKALIHNLSQLCLLLNADDQTPKLIQDSIEILQVNLLGQNRNVQAEKYAWKLYNSRKMLQSVNEEPELSFTNEFEECRLSFVRRSPSKGYTVGFIEVKTRLEEIGADTFSKLVFALAKQQGLQEQQAGARAVAQSRGSSAQMFSSASKQ